MFKLSKSKKIKNLFKKNKSNKKRYFSFLPLLIALIGVGFALSLMIAGLFVVFFTSLPDATADNELKMESLLERVSKHILVNQFEQPIIATVEDPLALKQSNPDFYQYAQIGDSLIIWSDKAILYSGKHDVILGVLPLGTLSASGQGKVYEAELVEQPKIEVRNGTYTPSLARGLVNILEEEGFDALNPRDSYNKPYKETLVINASDQEFPDTMERMLELTGGIESELPISETNVKGDILIILGEDHNP